MEKKLKLTELADYYIERYNIRFKEENEGVKTNNLEDNLYQQIKRQLQRARINNVSLYDTLKFKGQSGPRKISVSEFEKYCFEDFDKYIIARLTDYDYDKDLLSRDYEKYTGETDHQTEMNVSTSADPDELGIKYKMMISAIYDVFYDGFAEEKLQDDILKDDQIRLNDYKNYVGKRKIFA